MASLISRDLKIFGNELQIVTNGELVVEGIVTGDILAKDVQIGSEAVVTGLVNARMVTVAGTVAGSIRAEKITLTKTAKVNAELHQNSLIIEEGAKFEGQSRHDDDAAALLPNLERAAE